jgi:hypothetical protein
MPASKAVIQEFAVLRDRIAEVKGQFSGWVAEWSAYAERAEEARLRTGTELEAIELSHGKQMEQWALKQVLDSGNRSWHLPPEPSYLANKLRQAYEQNMALVDEAFKAKTQQLAVRSKLRMVEESNRALRSRFEESRDDGVMKSPRDDGFMKYHLTASREPPLSLVGLKDLDTALCRCEEALAQDQETYQPEEEQDADGHGTRCARDLRDAQLRITKLEQEVTESRDRELSRQATERERNALRNRVELLEAKLENIASAPDPQVLPSAYDLLAAVDKREREMDKLEIGRLKSQLDEFRLSRVQELSAFVRAAALPPWPAKEWASLGELLEAFGAAVEESEDREVLASRAREIARFCSAACSALRGCSAVTGEAELVASLRSELSAARRKWSEACTALLARPTPPKITLAHMDCCLRADELECRLRTEVGTTVQRAQPVVDDGHSTEALEDYAAKCARLEIELDNLSQDYQNKVELLNEAHASIEQYKISNRNYLREAAECRAQYTVSNDSQQKEIDVYLNKISALQNELQTARKELRTPDHLAPSVSGLSVSGTWSDRPYNVDGSRSDRDLIDAHVARIAEKMSLQSTRTVDRVAELFDQLQR